MLSVANNHVISGFVMFKSSVDLDILWMEKCEALFFLFVSEEFKPTPAVQQ